MKSIFEPVQSQPRMQLISAFVDTYLKLSAQEQQIFEDELAAVQPSEQETVMELVTSWMEEGIEKGKKQEALKVALRLLERRVGEMDSLLQEKVAALTTEQLEDLHEATFGIETPQDLENWLARLQ